MDHVGRFWKGKGRHKLESVTQRLGIPWFGQAHRASADCRATGWVLWHLREHLPGDADEAATLIFEARQRQNEDFQRWRASQPPREATSESS